MKMVKSTRIKCGEALDLSNRAGRKSLAVSDHLRKVHKSQLSHLAQSSSSFNTCTLRTMFAVPGWSISTDKLKVQTAATAPSSSREGRANGKEDGEKRSKKRKRGGGKNVEVTEENLGDLWAKHLEANDLNKTAVKGAGSKESKKKKKRKAKDGEEVTENAATDDAEAVNDLDEADSEKPKKKKKKEKDGLGVKEKKEADDTTAGAEDGDEEPKNKNKRERVRGKYEARAKAANVARLATATGEQQGLERVPTVNGMDLSVPEPELEDVKPTSALVTELSALAKQDALPRTESAEGDEAKAKFERRKAKTERKKGARALKEADGTLPPSRPPAGSEPATSTTPKDFSKTASSHTEGVPTASKSSKTSSFTVAQTTQPTPAHLTPITKLTPLQQKMTAKLISARFRHLNETLYTHPSTSALALFTSSPAAYSSYHTGFRAQVAVWPSNPIQGFISDIKLRGGVRRDRGSQAKAWRGVQGKKSKGKGKAAESDASAAPEETGFGRESLPRTKGVCCIVDLGCGDASLAAELAPFAPSQKLNLKIQSFDLATGDGPNASLVTVADTTDLAKAGVMDAIVDIAICCLSLMGTNWVAVVDECSRIVHAGGEVWVAEIRSRFVRPQDAKKKDKVSWSVGAKKEEKKKKPEKGGKKAAGADEEEYDAVTMEELDEKPEGPRDDTDVSAFVEVWKKRGFSLKGEPDASNNMFVKMRFMKERAPLREEGEGRGFVTSRAKMAMSGTKFIEKEAAEVEEVDEGKVLKPCLYKTR